MYMKEQYVFRNDQIYKAVIRNYCKDDFDDLISVQKRAFPPPFPSELWWNKDQLAHHLSHFPLGAMCVEVDGKLVGSMTSLIVDFDPLEPHHTWEDITDDGYIRTHKETSIHYFLAVHVVYSFGNHSANDGDGLVVYKLATNKLGAHHFIRFDR